MDTKTIVSCIVHATLEYGCGSVFGDLADLGDSWRAFRTKPMKRAIKHLSAGVLGTYLGSWCADKVMRDIDTTVKDILEIKARDEEPVKVAIKKEESDE